MDKIHVGAIDCSFNYCGCAILNRTPKGEKYITTTRIIENPKLENKKTSASLVDLDRCSVLHSGVARFVEDLMYKVGIKVLAFEVPGGSQSQRAAACLGMAKGVLGSILSVYGMRNYLLGSWMRAPVMPSEVHKRVTGTLKATKEEIMEYVLKNYPTDIRFDKKKYWVHQLHEDAPVTLEGYTKGQFEHIADAIVMAEIGFERIKE